MNQPNPLTLSKTNPSCVKTRTCTNYKTDWNQNYNLSSFRYSFGTLNLPFCTTQRNTNAPQNKNYCKYSIPQTRKRNNNFIHKCSQIYIKIQPKISESNGKHDEIYTHIGMENKIHSHWMWDVVDLTFKCCLSCLKRQSNLFFYLKTISLASWRHSVTQQLWSNNRRGGGKWNPSIMTVYGYLFSLFYEISWLADQKSILDVVISLFYFLWALLQNFLLDRNFLVGIKKSLPS